MASARYSPYDKRHATCGGRCQSSSVFFTCMLRGLCGSSELNSSTFFHFEHPVQVVHVQSVRCADRYSSLNGVFVVFRGDLRLRRSRLHRHGGSPWVIRGNPAGDDAGCWACCDCISRALCRALCRSLCCSGWFCRGCSGPFGWALLLIVRLRGVGSGVAHGSTSSLTSGTSTCFTWCSGGCTSLALPSAMGVCGIGVFHGSSSSGSLATSLPRFAVSNVAAFEPFLHQLRVDLALLFRAELAPRHRGGTVGKLLGRREQ